MSFDMFGIPGAISAAQANAIANSPANLANSSQPSMAQLQAAYGVYPSNPAERLSTALEILKTLLATTAFQVRDRAEIVEEAYAFADLLIAAKYDAIKV